MGFISINIKPLLSYDLSERFYEELADSDGDWTKSGWLSDNVLQDLQKTSYIEYLIEKFGHRVEEKVSIGQQKLILIGQLSTVLETFLSDGSLLKIFKKKFYMATKTLTFIHLRK